MKKSVLLKNGILSLEVLLCLVALFLVFFRHSVSGFETETQLMPQAEEITETWESKTEEPVDLGDLAEMEEITESKDAKETVEPIEAIEAEEDYVSDEQVPDVLTEEPEMSKPLATGSDEFLILANKYHYISTEYVPNLKNVNGYQIDERIADDLQDMMDAAKEEGINLRIVSAYRSKEKQTRLFQNKIRKYRQKGMVAQEAYEEASRSVAIPGTSEHQLGLALDILGSGYGSLNEGFADTKAGEWLAENCAKYGFILRYPKDKEEITGIIFEPWHFRYVGNPHALKMTDQELTLEEYTDLYMEE